MDEIRSYAQYITLCKHGVIIAWWSFATNRLYAAIPRHLSMAWNGHQCTRAEALLILTALKAQLEKENGL